MRSIHALTMVAALSGACAAGGPVFEFRPTDTALRYDMYGANDFSVETPMGSQLSQDSAAIAISVEIGGGGPQGNDVAVVFDAFSARSTAQGTIDGGGLVGARYRGLLKRDGSIEVVEGPEVPARLRGLVDPKSILADLMVPLPPEGHDLAEPWPVTQETVTSTQMSMTTRFNGMARLAGDTVWHGIAARVIVVEGEFQMEGRGTPEGSPAEIAMSVSGSSERSFLWDAARGVMLVGTGSGEGTGQVEVVGMNLSMPAKVTSRSLMELRP